MGFQQQLAIGGKGQRRVMLGKGLPPVIQTMWKDPLPAAPFPPRTERDMLSRIERLEALGCRLLRFAVPDMQSAEALGALAQRTAMPLVADIHFDYRLALRCLDFPVAKIRINPGNIGSRKRTAEVLRVCAAKGVPIRIGLNAGSLPLDLRNKLANQQCSPAQALLAAAERELELFDEFAFSAAVVSLKASSVQQTIDANELFASRYAVPLHIGVTEAGPLIAGVVRNTAALFRLLRTGIGDTVRVSLSDNMEHEVIAAKEILLAAERIHGARIISCPRCGRCGFDTHRFTEQWMDRFYALDADITIAVMGCAVNGPGEARDADIGITGAGNKILIFKQGRVVRTVSADEAGAAFHQELDKLLAEQAVQKTPAAM